MASLTETTTRTVVHKVDFGPQFICRKGILALRLAVGAVWGVL